MRMIAESRSFVGYTTKDVDVLATREDGGGLTAHTLDGAVSLRNSRLQAWFQTGHVFQVVRYQTAGLHQKLRVLEAFDICQ